MRNCSTCKSYGLVRCVLCDGSGIISWEGKFLHEDLCPSCMGKRYCSCPECGGMFKHRLFKHRRPIPVELMQSMDEAEVTVAATQNRTGGPRVQLD